MPSEVNREFWDVEGENWIQETKAEREKERDGEIEREIMKGKVKYWAWNIINIY